MKLHELMTEAQFQKWITDTAELYRWTWRHARDSRRQNLSDLPDLMLIREPRLLFLEVKTMKGKVSDGQRTMLDRLIKCDVEAYLVRPSDRDFIRELLV